MIIFTWNLRDININYYYDGGDDNNDDDKNSFSLAIDVDDDDEDEDDTNAVGGFGRKDFAASTSQEKEKRHEKGVKTIFKETTNTKHYSLR